MARQPMSRGTKAPESAGPGRSPLPRSAGGSQSSRTPPAADGPKDKGDIRQKMKEQLLKRQQEAEDRAENFGGSFLDFGEKKVTVWKPGNGDHLIDIIPYNAGASDPNCSEGEATYGLSIKVHRGLGPSKNQEALCLAENFQQDCPVCEHRIALRDAQEDKEVWKKLFPSKRSIYNILCQDNEKELKKGVMVWNVADFYMESHILNIMRGPVRPGQITTETLIPFSHPEEGKSIAFKIDAPKSKDDYASYVGHRFVDRDYTTADYLKSAYTLDDFLLIKTYDELYELYWGQQGKKSPKPVDNEEEEAPFDETENDSDVLVEDQDIKDFCPVGGKWGIDNNGLPDCEECPQETWEECSKEKEAIQAQSAGKNKERRRRMRS